MTKRILMLTSALSVLSVGGGAYAATATAGATATDASQGGGTTIGELVVTAEKREQNLQEVPIAISAFTSQKRDLVGIQSIQDMTNFTPGLGYSTSTDRITLRGIGRTTNVLSADAPVANYDDGLYETFAVAAGRSSLDLARVEVLRGPQGTLAGRNALGGALNEITVRPSKEPYAEFRATYGNYDHITLEGAASGPLNDDWLWRVYGTWEKQSKGWIKNTVVGQPDSGNVINEWYADAQIQGHINDHLDMWTKVQSAQWYNGSGGPGADSAGWRNFGFPTGEFVGGEAFLYPNTGYACNPATQDPTNPNHVTNVVNNSTTGCNNATVNDPRKESEAITHRVKLPLYISLNSQWTWHADGFDIKYVGGGTYYHYILTGANAVSPIVSETLPLAPNGLCHLGFLGPCGALNTNGQYNFKYQELNGFFSNEINLISTGDSKLQWVAGAYQFHQHYTQPVTAGNNFEPSLLHPTLLASPGPLVHVTGNRPLFFDNRPSVSDASLAVFGQIDYQITDTIKLTGGLRYSHDRKYGTEGIRLLDAGNIVAPENFGTFGETLPGVAGPAFDLTQLCSVVDCAPGKGISSGTTYNPATGIATRHYDASWSGISGTAGIQWQPDTDTNAYFKYGRGYKSGGFNIGIFTVLSFQPWTDKETVDSFEVGFKKQFGHFLTANVAAYYYSYKNLQIPIAVAQTAGGLAQSETSFYNVPKALSQGIELETTWTPIDNLVILFNYSYDDAHITKGTAADSADPNGVAQNAKPLFSGAECAAFYLANPNTTNCLVDVYTQTLADYNLIHPGHPPADPLAFPSAIPGNPNTGWNIPQNLKGNRLPNAPKNKIAINVLYNLKTSMGTFTPSVSWVWRDVAYGSLFTNVFYKAPSWSQWDARVTWKSDNGKYEVIAFGKNIFNKIGYDQGSIPERLASVTNVIDPVTGTIHTVNYVQGVNGPAGFNVPVANARNGVGTIYYPTPPATYGVEFHYKFY